AAFLVKGKPSYVGDFLAFHAGPIGEHWAKLAECVRTGKPVVAVDKPVEGIPLWHALGDGLFPVGWKAATQGGEGLGQPYPGKPLRLLDVAAGSGVWGIGAATANPKVTSVAFDLPETLEHARRFAARSGLGPRIEFLEGDLRETDLGEARYDAAVLG